MKSHLKQRQLSKCSRKYSVKKTNMHLQARVRNRHLKNQWILGVERVLAVVVVEEVLAKAEGQMYHHYPTFQTKMVHHKLRWEYKLIHLKKKRKMMCLKSKASWTNFSAGLKLKFRKETIMRNLANLRGSLLLPGILNLMPKSRPPSLHHSKIKMRILLKRVKPNQQQLLKRHLLRQEQLENQQLPSLHLR